MSDTNNIIEGPAPAPANATRETSHGRRAGWFRVASGFSALAAIGMCYQSFRIARPSADAVVSYPPAFGGALAVGALCVAWASFRSLRGHLRAGLYLVMGYLIPAATLYLRQNILMAPGLLLVGSMLALIIATRRVKASTGFAA